jgi:hypothetical protein
MAKRKPKAEPKTQTVSAVAPAHSIRPSAYYRKSFGIDEQGIANRKMKEIGELLFFHKDCSDDENHLQLVRALELYESLEPADGAEGMLAAQMVGAHFAALECLRRAAIPDQSFASRDIALRHAHKLMSLYTQQLAALNKHRGKGQQKVTVEYVNVESGGQAIVGAVETGRAGSLRPVADIENGPEMPMQERKHQSMIDSDDEQS